MIIVPGNHDQCFETLLGAARELFGASVHVLEDEPLMLEGVTFYGSPSTSPFMRWHFMAEESRLATLYHNMPASVDVLVTHGPPYGILDPGWNLMHAGSTSLAAAVAECNVRHHVLATCMEPTVRWSSRVIRSSTMSQRATNNIGL